MSGQRPFLIRMSLFLALVVGVVVVLSDTLGDAFFANSILNGVILGALVIGIVYNFRQVLLLKPDTAWLAAVKSDDVPGAAPPAAARKPRLLAPLATMLADRRGRMTLSAVSLRSLLDGIGSRLDESRDLSRYMIGLLIFLGLLGTFWGLLQTVTSVGDVIGDLSVANQDMLGVFDDLKGGLEAPLEGMGTAFSSSLFGLAGRSSWAFSTSRRARRRTASTTSWRTGSPPTPGSPAARSAWRATSRFRPTSAPSWRRPPTAWRSCSERSRAAKSSAQPPRPTSSR